ncbi:MAG: energy-coupling factor ABC transporter ATP-binding protein, partial [Erysipelotrichaceae bacterium]|nr:energy-coupling factor ABC transporter ATP-binding protein [Erysipelotrichaceae bacterium]
AYEKDNPVLKDISFTAEDGECIGLIGANGAGKSTLMKVMLGLLDGNGSVIVDGTPVTQDTLAEIRRKLGFVLQNSDSQMFMPTVHDDMLFGLLNYGIRREEAEKKVSEVLDTLHISFLKDRYNHRISGGEKRMAAIATVLAMEPSVLLMDEPTSALDPKNRRMIINTIRSLKQTRIITSHDLDMILDTCSRVILIDEGRIIKDGTAEEILKDRELLEAHSMELPLSFSRLTEHL